jgi:hypothetical protein
MGVRSSKSYLSGLRDAHLAKKLPFMEGAVQQGRLTRLRSGAALLARVASSSSSRKKRSSVFAVTPLHVRLIVQNLPQLQRSKDGRLFLAVLVVLSYNGNRGGEIFPMSNSHSSRTRVAGDLLVSALSFDDPKSGVNGMTLLFPPMKTDKNLPVPVWLPSLPGDPTCPVSLLRASLADRVSLKRSDKLFQRPNKRPLTRRWILKKTRVALAQLSIEIPSGQKLSSKSWRSGMIQAVSALPSDVVEKVKASGRWKSGAFQPYLLDKAAHNVIAVAHVTILQARALGQQPAVAEAKLPSEGPLPNEAQLPDEDASSSAFSDSSESEGEAGALAEVAAAKQREAENRARAKLDLRPRLLRARLDSGLG